jgi:hypothetical protein
MNAPIRIPLSEEVRIGHTVADQLAAAGIDTDDAHYSELFASGSDLPDRLLRILRAARYVEADAETLGGMMKDMAERKARLERKAKSMRQTVLWAMAEVGLTKLHGPDLSASVSAGKPSVLITDEDALPDECCAFKRVPSKTAIAAALAEGPVPGACMSNGTPSLTIRTR